MEGSVCVCVGGGARLCVSMCVYPYWHFHAFKFKPEEKTFLAQPSLQYKIMVTTFNHLLCNKLFFLLANRTTEHQTLRANDEHWQPME